VEARAFVYMVRVRATSDEGLPGGIEVREAASELGKVHPLAQLLERVHTRSLRCSWPLLGHRLLSGKESVAQIRALAPSLQRDRFGTEPASPYRLSSCTIKVALSRFHLWQDRIGDLDRGRVCAIRPDPLSYFIKSSTVVSVSATAASGNLLAAPRFILCLTPSESGVGVLEYFFNPSGTPSPHPLELLVVPGFVP
jgi:hypothetical protein